MTEHVVYQQTNETYQEPVRVQLDPPPFQELLDHIAEIARSAGATLFSFSPSPSTLPWHLPHTVMQISLPQVWDETAGPRHRDPTELFFLGAPFFILVVFVYPPGLIW